MADYMINKDNATKNIVCDLDRYIGARVKARRIALGLSQSRLGAELGITFQQIQKYEKGVNRISASTLYHMTEVLSVNYSYFFEGYNGNSLRENNTLAYEFNSNNKKETTDLLRAYYKVSNVLLRKKILDLIKGFAISELKKEQL